MHVAIFNESGKERDFDCGSLAGATAEKLAKLPEVVECYVYEKKPNGDVKILWKVK